MKRRKTNLREKPSRRHSRRHGFGRLRGTMIAAGLFAVLNLLAFLALLIGDTMEAPFMKQLSKRIVPAVHLSFLSTPEPPTEETIPETPKEREEETTVPEETEPLETPTERSTEAAPTEQEELEVAIPTTEAIPVEKITILAVGDNLIHKEIDVTVEKEDGSYDFSGIYALVRPVIEGADLAILNQEVPAGGRTLGISGYPNFNAPTEVIDAVAEMGFDVLTMATNHALDKGQKGIDLTLSYIKSHYPELVTVGVASSAEEERIPVLTVKGIRIAILNYTYGTNGWPLPNPWSVRLLSDKEGIIEDLLWARAHADYVIVCPHWGDEYATQPNRQQREYARLFNEYGADLVIGTHPHVLQPMEVMISEEGWETTIYYSLGNFLSAQTDIPRTIGGMAEIVLEVKGGRIQKVQTDINFVVTQYDFTTLGWTFDNFKLYMLKDYPKELAKEHGVKTWKPDFTFNSWEKIIKRLFPWWEEH